MLSKKSADVTHFFISKNLLVFRIKKKMDKIPIITPVRRTIIPMAPESSIITYIVPRIEYKLNKRSILEGIQYTIQASKEHKVMRTQILTLRPTKIMS